MLRRVGLEPTPPGLLLGEAWVQGDLAYTPSCRLCLLGYRRIMSIIVYITLNVNDSLHFSIRKNTDLIL